MALQQDIQTAIESFAKIERIDPSGAGYKALCTLLDRCDDAALKTVHAANIRFVSLLAFNRMIRRGLVHAPAAS